MAWLTRIFAERRRTGQTDLKRWRWPAGDSTPGRSGSLLQQLLHYEERLWINAPGLALAASRRITWNYVPSVCLSVLGEVELSRPYYLCKQCGEGQFPVDQQLGCEADQEYSGSTPYVGLGRAPNRFPTGKGGK